LNNRQSARKAAEASDRSGPMGSAGGRDLIVGELVSPTSHFNFSGNVVGNDRATALDDAQSHQQPVDRDPAERRVRFASITTRHEDQRTSFSSSRPSCENLKCGLPYKSMMSRQRRCAVSPRSHAAKQANQFGSAPILGQRLRMYPLRHLSSLCEAGERDNRFHDNFAKLFTPRPTRGTYDVLGPPDYDSRENTRRCQGMLVRQSCGWHAASLRRRSRPGGLRRCRSDVPRGDCDQVSGFS
jgi:hypothetical protein